MTYVEEMGKPFCGVPVHQGCEFGNPKLFTTAASLAEVCALLSALC